MILLIIQKPWLKHFQVERITMVMMMMILSIVTWWSWRLSAEDHRRLSWVSELHSTVVVNVNLRVVVSLSTEYPAYHTHSQSHYAGTGVCSFVCPSLHLVAVLQNIQELCQDLGNVCTSILILYNHLLYMYKQCAEFILVYL